MLSLSREEDTPLSALTRQHRDPGDGHTGLMCLAHGEHETHCPMAWINTFRELDETGVPFAPWLARPSFLTQLREECLRAGQGHHREGHLAMVQSLEEAFREKGDADLDLQVRSAKAGRSDDRAALERLRIELASRLKPDCSCARRALLGQEKSAQNGDVS